MKGSRKKSFESLRRVVRRHRHKEFLRVERGCWKGSVKEVLQREEAAILEVGERVLQREKLLFEGIEREF